MVQGLELSGSNGEETVTFGIVCTVQAVTDETKTFGVVWFSLVLSGSGSEETKRFDIV